MKMDELLRLVEQLTREMIDAEGKAVPHLGSDTKLFGPEGILDSMGIISLVVAFEQALEDRVGRPVALADERAVSQSSGPYRTVQSLAEYASSVLGDV